MRPLLWLTLASIALRFAILLGRGDYISFDEGWYLLLGRNLVQGAGYTLTGLQHVTLSPLFPVLAGALSLVIDNAVWAGRIVAAVASGLLVWPCWHIFDRLADRRTTWIACVFVAVMPSLAAFAAPYWIGWDLWVGAEPLLHLLLYAGLAFTLRAWSSDETISWAGAGCMFALAYLARPEAILPLGIIGLLLTARILWRRTSRSALHVLVLGLAFALTAAPYWLYLHDSLGRWALTGRGVQVTRPVAASGGADADNAPSARIESMLWEDDQRAYMYSLYGLDPSATRLSSAYWGIREERPAIRDTLAESDAAPALPANVARNTGAQTDVAPATTDSARPVAADAADRPSRWSFYLSALPVVVPWYVWPFIAFGLFGARRAARLELLVAVPLLLTSIAIARIVAVDPRTQLFLAPLAAFYAARGVRNLALLIEPRLEPGRMRRGFIGAAAATILASLMVATEARWVYLGLSLGSPHHLVGSANRRTGEALREVVPAGESVMSWHPALALYADRDWRVLPHAPFDDVVRYATATGSEHVVLSVYYPSPLQTGQMPGEYLLVHVPAAHSVAADGLQLRIDRVSDTLSTGRVLPVR